MTDPLRLGPEQYLPAWTLARSAASGLLYVLLQGLVEATLPATTELERARDGALLTRLRLGARRYEWAVPGWFPDRQELAVTWSAGSLSGAVRAADSPRDWEAATDPVWWLPPGTGTLLLRNLHVREAALTSLTGSYAVTGESLGLVPDGDVQWRRESDPAREAFWRRLPAEGPGLTRAADGAQLVTPASGALRFRYPSLAYATALLSGTAVVRGPYGATRALPLALRTPDNAWDAASRVPDLPRRRRSSGDWEDQAAYRARLLAQAGLRATATGPGLACALAGRLGRLTPVTWDGVSLLTLDETGASGITVVQAPGLPYWRQVTETLEPEDTRIRQQFRASYGSWQPGWVVRVAGIPTATLTLTGNRISFPTPVSGAVTASYAVRLWNTTQDASGHLRTLVPGVGLPSGAYTVYLARGPRAVTLDQDETRRSRLLTPEGLPNGRFLSLASRLRVGDPTRLGRARWGSTAVWLLLPGPAPEPQYLLPPFDAHD